MIETSEEEKLTTFLKILKILIIFKILIKEQVTYKR